MTLLRAARFAGLVLLLGAAFLPGKPADAAFGQFLCAPSPVDQFSARTIGGTNSQVPSQTLYALNGQGCAFIVQQDVGYFLSQGFTGGQNFFTLSLTGVTANTTTSNSPTLPPGTYIHNIVIAETAGNAVTGGVKIGTTAGGTDIVAAATVSGNALVTIPDSALLKRSFGTGPAPAAQQIFFGCVTSCNSASLNISILYSYF